MIKLGNFNISKLQYQILNSKSVNNDSKNTDENIEKSEKSEKSAKDIYKDYSEQIIKSEELISEIIKAEILKSSSKNEIKKRIQYFDHGGYSIYELDEQCRDLRCITYDAKGTLISEMSFIYNEDGTQKHIVKNNNGIITQITELDNNGRVFYNKWFDETGKLISMAEYFYTDDNKEKSITKDAYGNINNIRVFDKNTNRYIVNENYNDDGTLRSYTKYEYNDDGSCVEKEYNSENKVISITKRDENGELVACVYDGGKELLFDTKNYNKEHKLLFEQLNFEKDKNNKNALIFFTSLGNLHNQIIKTKSAKNMYNVNEGDKYLKDISKLHKGYVLALEEKNRCFDRIEYYCNKILSYSIPKLPQKSEYKDEDEYYKALQNYYEKLYEYEQDIDELKARIQIMYHDVANFSQDMLLLSNKLNKLSKEFYEKIF